MGWFIAGNGWYYHFRFVIRGASAPLFLRVYMLGVVLGNGPSRDRYDRTGEFVLACNIPSEEFSVDATVICDEEIVWVLKNNLTLIEVPVIISTKVFEKMKELKIVDNFNILHVFQPKPWYNAAHYAAEFLLGRGCDEIHLWGCDSIFNDTVVSSTGNLTKQTTVGDDRFIRQWRAVWNTMQLNNPEVRYVAMRLPK